MPLAIPPELKPITAYIRRAEELDADKSDPNNRIIAFYCRSYAMEKAINAASSGGESVQSFLMNLMQDLENVKSTIGVSKDEAKVLCEGFAVNIFHRADDQDRGENDNYRETARIFYNSSTFFDILEQFGPLDEEINSKRTYSKWKATEIMKALKEGRTPTPGGYGGDDASTSSTDNTTPTINVPPPSSTHVQDQGIGGGGNSPSGFNLPTAPSGIDRSMPTVLPDPPGSFHMPQQPQYGQSQQQFSGQLQPPPPQQHFQPPQQQFQPPVQPQQFQPPQQVQQSMQPLQPQSHQPAANYVPPPKGINVQSNISDALELCAFAMAALKVTSIKLVFCHATLIFFSFVYYSFQHNDTKTGRERLQAALNMLG